MRRNFEISSVYHKDGERTINKSHLIGQMDNIWTISTELEDHSRYLDPCTWKNDRCNREKPKKRILHVKSRERCGLEPPTIPWSLLLNLLLLKNFGFCRVVFNMRSDVVGSRSCHRHLCLGIALSPQEKEDIHE